ncbi:hypothetical protein [Nakamurella sp. UYEF19]|uniref:hypothetical protein n=1 Tax=Nakamurella sp. UYEF19 TaxID=1756392 RepID=UPI00339B100D
MGTTELDGALEEVLAAHDSEWCLSQCSNLLASVEGDALTRLKALKGSYGGPLGRSFVDRFPNIDEWPLGFQHLISCLGYTSRSEESL